VTHVGLGIRCDFSPCLVQGSLRLRVKGVQLPPRTKPKRRNDSKTASHDQIVDRHYPTAIRLVVAGRTFVYDPGFVFQVDEVAPRLEFEATAHGIRVRSGPLLQAGERAGVLTFKRQSGPVRIPVSVRIVRVA
jgi:hypothetical protein